MYLPLTTQTVDSFKWVVGDFDNIKSGVFLTNDMWDDSALTHLTLDRRTKQQNLKVHLSEEHHKLSHLLWYVDLNEFFQGPTTKNQSQLFLLFNFSLDEIPYSNLGWFFIWESEFIFYWLFRIHFNLIKFLWSLLGWRLSLSDKKFTIAFAYPSSFIIQTEVSKLLIRTNFPHRSRLEVLSKKMWLG